MKVLDWDRIDMLHPPQGVALTIGVFDGVHAGHRELIHRIERNNFRAESLVVTFRDHPLKVLQHGGYPGNVLSLDQKLERLAALGLHWVLLIDFSPEFSKLSGAEFIGRIHALLRPHLVVLGKDFRCGHRNDTDALQIRALLAPQGVEVDIVDPVLDNGIPVSSTRIREAIQAGDLHTTRRLLGSDYFLHLQGVRIERNQEHFAIPVSTLPQVVPSRGVFRVTMYDGLPSFQTDSGTAVGSPAPRRKATAQVVIEDGKLCWPIAVGGEYTHMRFDGWDREEGVHTDHRVDIGAADGIHPAP